MPSPPPPPPPPVITSAFPFDDGTNVSARTAAYNMPYFVDLKSLKGSTSNDAHSLSVTVYAEFEPFRFARAMLGRSEVVEDDAGDRVLSRTPPEKLPFPSFLPDYDSGEKLKYWCTSCNLAGTFSNGRVDGRDERWLKPQPVPAWGSWPRARWAAYECHFTAVPFDVLTDAELTAKGLDADGYRKEWERNAIYDDERHWDLEKIPNGTIVYQDGAGVVHYPVEGVNGPNNAARRVGYMRRRVTWLDLPELPPDQNFVDCAMKANSVPFMGFDAQKVLFECHNRRPKTNVVGDRLYDLTLDFVVRLDRRNWNQILDKTDTLRDLKVWLNNNPVAPVFRDTPPILLADLGRLFRFE